MEAASAPGSTLLTRDGAVPASPAAHLPTEEPIDGVARCSCCERFPLVGELITRRSGRKQGGWVCDRCEAAGRGERIGEAIEQARIRSIGGAMNVRRAA